ncbi:MAG: hypothetical protein HOV81_20825 [Kofleriaceae bacterium]|nr:hypothetical protein [Kofleriaceae bacterium]
MRSLAFAVVVIAACKAAPSPTLANVERTRSCIVSGRLTTIETDAPISMATVVLDGAPTQAEVGQSGDDGRFQILSLGTQTAMTIYYANRNWKRPLADGGCGRSIRAKITSQEARPILMWIIGPDGT